MAGEILGEAGACVPGRQPAREVNSARQQRRSGGHQALGLCEDHVVGGEVGRLAEGAAPKVLLVRVAQPVQQAKLGSPVQVSARLRRQRAAVARGAAERAERDGQEPNDRGQWGWRCSVQVPYWPLPPRLDMSTPRAAAGAQPLASGPGRGAPGRAPARAPALLPGRLWGQGLLSMEVQKCWPHTGNAGFRVSC